jgi:hypothetical protein
MGSCSWFPLPREEIIAWVDQHRETLPTTLAELSSFPIAFRKVIVNRVSPEQRTRFWQDHLRTFLAPEAGLTAEQQSFVAETIPTLSDIFGSPLPEAQAKMRALEDRMRQLFTQPQAAAMFGTIGPPEPPEGLPIPPGTRLTPH